MYRYKRNGFTLVELMAVIIIISLIALLTFPNIINQIKKTKKSNNKMIEDVVIEQAKKYVNDNKDEFQDDEYFIKIEELIDNGYVNEEIIKESNKELNTKYIVFRDNKYSITEDAYVELAYIESTGTQYIDTGVITKSGLEIETDVLFKNYLTDATIVGSRKGDDRFYLLHSYDNYFTIGYNGFYKSDMYINSYKKYSIYSKLNNGEQTLKVNNNIIMSKKIDSDINNNLNLYIFALNYNGTVQYPSSVRLYGLKIMNNGILIRDFIPVLDSNGVACLYDKVDKKFYYNSGEGDFIYKRKYEINIETNYIESTGTQYIDTGVIAKSGLEMEAEVLFRSVPYDATIVGSRKGDDRFYLLHSYPGQFTIGYGNYYSSGVTINPNEKYSVYSKLNNGEQILKVNNNIIMSKNIESDINNNLNLYIFALNWNGTAKLRSSIRLYSLKIKDNGILIRNFVPFLDDIGFICLYDKVEKKYYYNQGTGDFLYG